MVFTGMLGDFQPFPKKTDSANGQPLNCLFHGALAEQVKVWTHPIETSIKTMGCSEYQEQHVRETR